MNSSATNGNYLLAAVLAGDALISIKPPRFFRRCLNGVNFPENWWWTLIAIKSLAATGLIASTFKKNASITTVVSGGVLAYFACAITAHIRAKFLKQEFWINCLGMTALSATILANNVAELRKA
ncbi:TPA: hypothetical protein NJT62_002293 [Corynebacterium striatum]|nr:hypothetical protein [Corynebacterium striatum]